MFRRQLNVPNPLESLGVCVATTTFQPLPPKRDHAADNSNKPTTNARRYIKEIVVSLYFSGFYMKVSKEKY